jgi:Fe-S cluster assembly iron-binding protein IscA
MTALATDTDAITCTDKARAKAYSLMAEAGISHPEYFLRVGVKGGGCSGLTYELDITYNKPELSFNSPQTQKQNQTITFNNKSNKT